MKVQNIIFKKKIRELETFLSEAKPILDETDSKIAKLISLGSKVESLAVFQEELSESLKEAEEKRESNKQVILKLIDEIKGSATSDDGNDISKNFLN